MCIYKNNRKNSVFELNIGNLSDCWAACLHFCACTHAVAPRRSEDGRSCQITQHDVRVRDGAVPRVRH